MSTTVWAAWDFPADPPNPQPRQRWCFTTPPQVLSTALVAEVPGVVAAAEAAALAGHWVLGGLTYTAAGAWDAAQAVRSDGGVLAHFEVYPGEPEPWPEPVPTAPRLEWLPDAILAEGRTAEAAIAAVQARIAAGEFYQVNLTGRWRATRPVDLDAFALFGALAAAQPDGYLFFSRLAGVASVSPELFFHRRGSRIITQPMKGTAPAERPGAELQNSAKDRAENLMIVDLLRNDLSRVCRPGTVRVERLFELHRLPTVWQLTSTVSGEANPDASLADVFAALFPCGSVTGAPKVSAIAAIAELEADDRRWYSGALGVIRPGGEATFNVPIRTVEAGAQHLVCGIGSGIVADSDPSAEHAEWHAKSRFLGTAPLRMVETMVCVDGRLQRWGDHRARLRRSATALGVEVSLDAIEAALAAACPPSGRHRVRLVAGDGEPVVEVEPAPATDLPVVLQLAAEPLELARLRPVIVHKTSYRDHYRRLLTLADPGVFDVICHADGLLTECSFGNLALRLDGVWVTPRDEGNLLPGVLRTELLASGRLSEARLPVAALAQAEEVAFFNALRGWCPATLA